MTSRIAVAWALARPKTLSVGSPATTSRKCPASRCSSRAWRCIRVAVEAPTSAMNSGMSGTVTAMMSADTQSAPSATTTTATGTMTARKTWGT